MEGFLNTKQTSTTPRLGGDDSKDLSKTQNTAGP